MKRQHPADSKKTPAIAAQGNAPLTLLNMGDSLEVMRSYYVERIQELEGRLKGLNLLENAPQIVLLCHEIIRAKKGMRRLNRGLHGLVN
jgi:hypothetical protein